MNDLEEAIRNTLERRKDAKDALAEQVVERDSEERTPGEMVSWSAELRLYENAVDLEERRLAMLRRQR